MTEITQATTSSHDRSADFAVTRSMTLPEFMDSVGRFRPAEMRSKSAEIVDALQAAIRVRDPLTSRHQSRTGYLCGAIAKLMGFGQEASAEIALAGYVHDVGKLTTPLAILQKEGGLADHEFDRVKEHPGEGHRMISGLELSKDVKDAVLYHHERLDGSGYPFGLMGNDISMVVRIVAVADIVDAVSNDRPYRRALPPLETISLLRQDAGTKLDEEVVEAASFVLRRFVTTGSDRRISRGHLVAAE